MENIEIRLVEKENNYYNTGWLVKQGEKFADGLGYEEMLGLIAALTMPKNRRSLEWMKTREEVRVWDKKFKSFQKSKKK